jgi:hypothetical protein
VSPRRVPATSRLRASGGYRNAETRLCGAILDALLWDRSIYLQRANTGAVRMGVTAADPRGRLVRFGKPGTADLVGLIKPTGRFFAVEVKTEAGKLSPFQASWLAEVNAFGGYACVVRSVADALMHAEQAKAGLPGPAVGAG